MSVKISSGKICLILHSLTFIFYLCCAVALYEGLSTYFNILNVGEHSAWLNSHTLNALRNWYSDGAINLGLLNVLLPENDLASSITDRVIYPSYPPGHLLGPHLLSLLQNNPIDLASLRILGLAGHFVSAFFVYLIANVVLRHASHRIWFVQGFSIFAGLFYLFLPKNVYWAVFVYFADQAIIPIFLATILTSLYVFENSNQSNGLRNKRLAFLFTSLTIFWGTVTDYLYFFITPLLLLFFVADGLRKRKSLTEIAMGTAFIFLPFLAAVGLYTSQLYRFGLIEAMIAKFQFRAAISPEGQAFVAGGFLKVIWQHVETQYGFYSTILALLGLALIIIRLVLAGVRDIFRTLYSPPILLFFFSFIPCFLQAIILKNHQMIHNFSAFKFSIPITFGLFVFIPIELSNALTKARLRGFVSCSIVGSMLLVAGIAINEQFGRRKILFPDNSGNDRCADLKLISNESNINQNIVAKQTLLSTTFETPAYPPMDIYCLGKVVKKISTNAELFDILRSRNTDHVVFLEEGKGKELEDFLNTLNNRSDNRFNLRRLAHRGSFAMFLIWRN